MALFIGIASALVAALFARRVGLDRDRAFYPTVMIVIALLYVLFAAIGGSSAGVLLAEGTVGAAFIALATAGFKRSLWFVVAALAAHGLFDFFHPHAIHNPGVPVWWPEFCGAYDLVAALVLAWQLRRPGPARKASVAGPAAVFTASAAGDRAGRATRRRAPARW